MTPQRIGSHYLLHEQIGLGGMGTVWRAEDVEAGTWRAIKVLKPEYARDPAVVARFASERDALLAFQHPNVVTLHDMIVEEERLALVMDLLTDGDLDRFRRDRGGVLPTDLAAELIAQVCDGLAAAHAAGIVHGDLKPANVLMDADRARLTDFGIARMGGADTVTGAGTVIGTVSYMSPEALSGADPAPADDVYAVGVMLYELLEGRQPFTREEGAGVFGHPRTVPPRPDGIPEQLWQLTAACQDTSPGARPAAAELAAALRNPWLLAGAPAAPAAFGEGAGVALPAPVPTPESVVPTWQQSDDEAFGRPGPGMPAASSPGGPPPVSGFQPLGASALTPAPALKRARTGLGGSAKGRRRRGAVAAVAAAVVIVVGGGVGAYAALGHPHDTADPAPLPSLTAGPATQTGAALSASLRPSEKPKGSASRSGSGSPASSPTTAVQSNSIATSAATPTTIAPPAVTPTAIATPAATTTPAATRTTTAAAAAPTPSVSICSAFPSAGTSFWRCNGTAWLPISCAVGEYNGTDGPYNVLKASSQCSDRVWLHQYAYPQDVKSGWTYCISPKPAGAVVQIVPTKYAHPLNIQVSSNPNNCL